jgi:hypothetical protein
MQTLLRSPTSPHARPGGGGGKVAKIAIALFAIAYIALYVLPGGGREVVEAAGAEVPVHIEHREALKENKINGLVTRKPFKRLGKDEYDSGRMKRRREEAYLPTWGYNADRNLARFKCIYMYINDLTIEHHGSFTMVDYGADQGFFSISMAHAFPDAVVMAVEMGGVGGEIWKKKGQLDVLKIQENKMKEHKVTNVVMCQTKVQPEQFFALKEKNIQHDFQLVLSIFHWFDLKTREEFEKTIVTLFHNARRTIIELPTIGDNGALIRKQVGYKNFAAWYDGRTDVGQIIRESGEAQGVKLSVELLCKNKWLEWTRDVYAVSIVDDNSKQFTGKFDCDGHKEVYGCTPRESKYTQCV